MNVGALLRGAVKDIAPVFPKVYTSRTTVGTTGETMIRGISIIG